MSVLDRVRRFVLQRMPAGWRSGEVVAAQVEAHRSILDQEPELRHLIEDTLRERLAAVKPPRWRLQEAWLHEVNAARALRGELPLSPWWDDRVEVMVTRDGADYFERNTVALVGTVRRRPTGPRPLFRALVGR